MYRLGAWYLVVMARCANGEVSHDTCAGNACGASESSVLLQSRMGVADAIEASVDEAGVAHINLDADGDADVDCATLKRGSSCRSNGCSWSGAFVGEKKKDGSGLSGYICADDEEVEEEVHDKLVNGTGSLIEMLEDESEISSKGDEERWCRRRRRRRRRGVGWSCPYCRRRRAPPPPPAKIEANGCPTGFKDSSTNPAMKCPGSGTCCTRGWTANCNQGCAQTGCTSTGGSWIPLNYASNSYTCEVPKLGNPSKYSAEPKADNAGFDCLCAVGTGYCGMASTWYGTLAAAQIKCDGNAECKYLHDWKADGRNWRACRTIKSPGDQGAGIKKKVAPAPTSAPTAAAGKLFNSIDGNGDEAISRDEFQKAVDAGQITGGATTGGATTVEPPGATTGGATTVKPPGATTVKPPGATTVTTAAPTAMALLTQSQKDAIVQKHNALRAGLGASDMTKMTWDDALGNAAQQYVSGLSLLTQQSNESSQKCPSGHSQNRANSVGENIAWKWSTGFQFTHKTDFTSAVQSWYDEIKDAGLYKTGGPFSGFGQCSGTCGHYTQVVWAAANKIGCGAAYCPHSTGMGGYELVCQYGTSVSGGYGGNMGGATVFTTGTACSKCPSNLKTCSNNLCA